MFSMAAILIDQDYLDLWKTALTFLSSFTHNAQALCTRLQHGDPSAHVDSGLVDIPSR